MYDKMSLMLITKESRKMETNKQAVDVVQDKPDCVYGDKFSQEEKAFLEQEFKKLGIKLERYDTGTTSMNEQYSYALGTKGSVLGVGGEKIAIRTDGAAYHVEHGKLTVTDPQNVLMNQVEQDLAAFRKKTGCPSK